MAEIKFKNVIKDPHRVFNGDETGFEICPHFYISRLIVVPGIPGKGGFLDIEWGL